MDKPGKILIIDDDSDYAESMRLVLEGAGHRTLVASTGRMGVEVARREHPDVILVDLLMAPDDGFETCDQLRSLPETRRTAILVVSAIGAKMHKSFSSPEIGTRLDADGFLEKPVEPANLVRTVAEMLRLARSRAEQPEEVR